MPNFVLVTPELIMLAAACLVLMVDRFVSEERRAVIYGLSQAALVATAAAVLALPDGQVMTFQGSFVHDVLAAVLKVSLLIVVAIVFVYSKDYLRERDLFKGEFYVLGLFATLGMMVMSSAGSLLSLYLGLELLSLSLYAMVAFNRESEVSSEAAMKYFVLGALASGILLYGVSMVYGATGSLGLAEVSAEVARLGSDDMVLVFGLAFVVVGVAFKLGAVPFHMWIPDVYHGAPTAVVVFIGSATKIAAFAMVMRLLVDGLGGLHDDWQGMLLILAVLSLAIGNVVAIAQVNIKRMLAYSTISHVGFVLMGVLAGTSEGYSAALFYMLTYALMAAGAFGMVILLSRAGFEADQLDDFKGLNERSPWFAAMMLIMMFSMAGVPPMVGFYGKFLVLRAIIHVDLIWLAIVAIMFSIIGAFYYLRVVKLMYFDEPEDRAPLEKGMDARMVMSANGLAVLGFGIYPGALLSLCMAAFA